MNPDYRAPGRTEPGSGVPNEEPDTEPVLVDARGLRCPLPVIRLANASRDQQTGTRVVVWSTDPAARVDIPAWARMRGHAVVSTEELPDDGLAITVELGA